MIQTFTDFKAAEETKNGKMAPAKAKAHDGNWYALGRGVEAGVILAAIANGHPLEVDTSTKVNGKFTNYYLNSAKKANPTNGGAEQSQPVSRTTPQAAPSASAPSTSSVDVNPTQKNASRASDPDSARQRLIVRQSSLKSAVDFAGVASPTVENAHKVLELADIFFHWVFKEEAYRNGVEQVGAGDSSVGELPPAPKSPAQKYLAEAQNKARDIRSTYSAEDMVCAECGRKEFIKPYQGSFFCAKRDGGCGAPKKGEAWLVMSYGEWLQGQGSTPNNIRRPEATVVGPANYPSRSRED